MFIHFVITIYTIPQLFTDNALIIYITLKLIYAMDPSIQLIDYEIILGNLQFSYNKFNRRTCIRHSPFSCVLIKNYILIIVMSININFLNYLDIKNEKVLHLITIDAAMQNLRIIFIWWRQYIFSNFIFRNCNL